MPALTPPDTVPLHAESFSARPSLTASSLAQGGQGARQPDAELVAVLGKARLAFPATEFTAAYRSPAPGWYQLEMDNGAYAFVDKSARYLILGLMFDGATGALVEPSSTRKTH